METILHGKPDRPHNRLKAILDHLPAFAMDGQARLAKATGLTRSAISRLARGQTQPMLWVALLVTEAIERELGRRLDLRELFSHSGDYPTPFVCSLFPGCCCLPADALNDVGQRTSGYEDMEAGRWSGDVHEMADLQPIKELA